MKRSPSGFENSTVFLYKGREPRSTAENLFRGAVSRIITGKVTTEIVVRIADGTELCSIITEASRQALAIEENDTLWAAFNAFAVACGLIFEPVFQGY